MGLKKFCFDKFFINILKKSQKGYHGVFLSFAVCRKTRNVHQRRRKKGKKEKKGRNRKKKEEKIITNKIINKKMKK